MSKRYQRRAPGSDPALEVPVRDHHRENQVDRVRRRIRELVEPWVTREVQDVGGGQGEPARRVVVIEHASLLDQLRAGGAPSSAGGSGRPESRPPSSLEASSLLAEIESEVREWGRATLPAVFLRGLQAGAGSRRRLTVALFEVLSSSAPGLGPDDLGALDADVLSWWGQARIATSWDRPPVRLAVACMSCETFGTLRVQLDPIVAVCRECRATWDEQSLGVLGQHVRLAQQDAGTDVVTAFVDRARGHGRAAPGATSSVEALLAGVGPDRPWCATPEDDDAAAVGRPMV